MIVVAGSLNMDLVGRVPYLPAPGETVLGSSFTMHQGGKGGNQAVAARRMGCDVSFCGAVGSDAFGDALVHGLIDEGIDVAGVRRGLLPTGCALINVDDRGDNTISVLPGANGEAPPAPDPWPASWRMLLLQLEIPAATSLAWARAARAAGATVVLNAAPVGAMPEGLIGLVDVLVVNEIEIDSLVGRHVGASGALAAAVGLGPTRVVVTLGGRGCLALDRDRHLNLPAHAVEVVDTVGAGDTFVGALAAELAQGRAFDVALARANAAAALACTRGGARGGMPSAAAVDGLLRAAA